MASAVARIVYPRQALEGLSNPAVPPVRQPQQDPQDVLDETWYQVLRCIETGPIPWQRRLASVDGEGHMSPES